MHIFKALLVIAYVHTFQGYCSCGPLTLAKELMDPRAHTLHFYLWFMLSELHLFKERGVISYPPHHYGFQEWLRETVVSKLAVVLVKLLNFVLSMRVHACRMNKMFVFTLGLWRLNEYVQTCWVDYLAYDAPLMVPFLSFHPFLFLCERIRQYSLG